MSKVHAVRGVINWMLSEFLVRKLPRQQHVGDFLFIDLFLGEPGILE